MPPLPLATEPEALSGVIEHVVFHNEENNFAVLRVKVRGYRDPRTVVGRVSGAAPGERLEASGRWTNSGVHGLQFEADFIRTSPPDSADGIETYLGSGAVPGVGPSIAGKLVAAFGGQVFDVIDNEPERLREVPGLGRVRIRRILAKWDEMKTVREIMVFLHRHGVGGARASRICKTYGMDAVQVISENPYRLSRDIAGIGFKIADGIAMKAGFSRDHPARIQAGIRFALDNATSDGNCGLPRDDLVDRVRQLLEVPDALVRSVLDAELEEGSLAADYVDGRPCVFLTRLYRAEARIARKLVAMSKGDLDWPKINDAEALPRVERKLGFTLAPSQAQAVRRALNSKVTVITGGPGVGKTTIVNAILRLLGSNGVEIALCAPTGRAAKRLEETTGIEAKTIHRLLGWDGVSWSFNKGPDDPLDCGLLVVDETSMVDVPLMDALLSALPVEAGLLLVGDVDQLPSVGPGQVLADLIGSGVLSVERLVEIFRQAAASRIVVNAHRVNRGSMPDTRPPAGDSDFYFVPAESAESAIRKTVEMVKNRIPNRFGLDPVRDIQVLCPMNKGAVGSVALNESLRAAVNPNPKATIQKGGSTFAHRDKVMQTSNDYEKEVYNGDIGFISQVDTDKESLVVNFDGREVEYASGDLGALIPAYATTIHKSQGSEYPGVVVPLMNSHFVMLQRNLLYTAITRGKRLVVLVGQRDAVRRAVGENSRSRRWSKLQEWMQGYASGDLSQVLPANGSASDDF